jgi:hypothetical protein
MRIFLIQKSLFLLNATEGLATDKKLYSHQCFLLPRSKNLSLYKQVSRQSWWCMPVISVLGRLRQED